MQLMQEKVVVAISEGVRLESGRLHLTIERAIIGWGGTQMKRYFEVNYRHAKHQGATGQTLQSAITAALAAQDVNGTSLWLRPDDRIMAVAGPDDEKLLFNTPADASKGIAGELCLFRKGALQPALDFTAKTVNTSTLSAATIYQLLEEKAPENREFITGICYWLVIENHVLFVTLKGFPKDFLTTFFDWLLKDLGVSAKLDAALDPSEVGSIGRVSKFVVKGSSGSPKFTATPVTTDGQAKIKKGRRAVPWDKAEEAIALTIGEDGLDRLKGSMGKRNALFAETEWGVLGPRTKKLKETLTELATELADSQEGDVSVMGKDGQIREGSVFLKSKMPFEVEGSGHYFLDFSDVVSQLAEVYGRFSTDDKLPK